jgi:hypothetical protein
MLQYGGLHLERSHLLTGTGEHECTQVDQGFGGNDDVAPFSAAMVLRLFNPLHKIHVPVFFINGGKRNVYIYRHFSDYDLT